MRSQEGFRIRSFVGTGEVRYWTPETLRTAALTIERGKKNWQMTLGRRPNVQVLAYWNTDTFPDNAQPIEAIAERVRMARG